MALGHSGWRRHVQARPAVRACRPACEHLENRLAPAVYHVNTAQDTPAADLAAGHDAAGHVSLRAAVMAANVTPEADTIVLGAGVFALNGGMTVQGKLDIVGQGPDATKLD